MNEEPFDLVETIYTKEGWEAMEENQYWSLKMMQAQDKIMYKITGNERYNRHLEEIISQMEDTNPKLKELLSTNR